MTRLRNSTFSLVILMTCQFSTVQAEDMVFEDFESNLYNNWEQTGEAFGDHPAKGTLPNQHPVTGFKGNQLVNSFKNGDGTIGSLVSKEFTINHPYISFLIGGGAHQSYTCLELWVENKLVKSSTGENDEQLAWKSWDVKDFQGKTARIRILDNHTGGWGHINVDHIVFTNNPRKSPGTISLSDYRASKNYYLEDWRPQIHFSPEINWMNDPNGMVFYDGEFHLFYQFNPFGPKWGHMSWGHAVSKDLYHWKHLPVALYEEDNIMIFSGSAVIDWNNSSNLASKDSQHPPMVAIYTGHYTNQPKGLQNQQIAYSLDKGRSWTKFSDNPVLDRNMADFRDPKVIWHEPTQTWVMVVCLPLEKKVAFYYSNDLKSWRWGSEFGPAGAVDGIWECPDLFPLMGPDGREHWVLIVNLNPGGYAGGSGGQYFVGQFDGKIFRPTTKTDDILWLDYGPDFYATVSWSDVPKEVGRRLAIGWMSNWLYANSLPVSPWRSAMSLPRQWSITGHGKKIRLNQLPTRELVSLRTSGAQLRSGTLSKANKFLNENSTLLTTPYEISFDIIHKSTTKPVGVDFFKNKKSVQQTSLTYLPLENSLEFDRTQSGEKAFSDQFASSTKFKLDRPSGRLRVRAIVDRSSIEFFFNDGSQTLTARVFPKSFESPISFFGEEKNVRVSSLQIWKLTPSMGGKDFTEK